MANFALNTSSYTVTKALCWGYCYEHSAMACQGNLLGRVVHAIIAFIEAIPIVSQIASLFEMVIVKRCSSSSPPAKNTNNSASPELQEVIDKTCKFTGYQINIEGQQGIVVGGMNIRPANLFFEALGIKTTMPTTDRNHIESGHLFRIRTKKRYIEDQLNKEGGICSFSAKGQKGYAVKEENRALRISFPDLTKVYGSNEYQISYKEIQETLDSQEIFLSPDLPLLFYVGLKEALQSRQLLPREGRNSPLLKNLEDDDNEPELRDFLRSVKDNPLKYNLTENSYERLKNMTLAEIGALVVKREDYRIFVDENGKILKRSPGENDAIRLINACGIRDLKRSPNVANIIKETFKTSLVAAKSGIILFPAVGMGIWKGDPDIYWRAFFDAIIESDRSFEAILVNPGHRKTEYGKYKGKAGDEFTEILKEYTTRYKNDEKNLAKLKKITDLYQKKTDLVQLARNLKKAYPKKTISLFNASDPNVTLGNHVGEGVNRMPLAATTEENYTAIGTNGLCFEHITGIHDEENIPRIQQVKK